MFNFNFTVWPLDTFYKSWKRTACHIKKSHNQTAFELHFLQKSRRILESLCWTSLVVMTDGSLSARWMEPFWFVEMWDERGCTSQERNSAFLLYSIMTEPGKLFSRPYLNRWSILGDGKWLTDFNIDHIFGMEGLLNSLWPSDAMWWGRSESTLALVMDWCLTVPNHYMDQCCYIISVVRWHSPRGNFMESPESLFCTMKNKNHIFNIAATSPREQWVDLLFTVHPRK